MTYHILGDGDVQVALAIVYLELEADKIRQYRGRAGLCLDRRDPFTCFFLNYWEAWTQSERPGKGFMRRLTERYWVLVDD